MLHKHITINQLISIQVYREKGVNALLCSKLMNIGKDKAYKYYRLFKMGLTILEIYTQYKENKKNCGRNKIEFSENKLEEVNDQLNKDWSVDAICGRDKLLDKEERCSTKTLYRMFSDKIFDVSKLRRKGKRKPNNHKETRGKINNCKTIKERDEKYPNLSNCKEFGHFEGDTIIGKKRKTAIVTLVEKQTKYIILLKGSRKSEEVEMSINKWFANIPRNIVKTIIFDRGKEFSRWKEIENLNQTEIYFSDPGSPGQRGLNENSNGIVRKDLPKSTDLSKYSQKELNNIANKWNSVPRKSLDYYTSNEVLKMATGQEKILPIA
jgi:transposase, IS30 family